MEKYKNLLLSPSERAKDLLERMSLCEKIGQLNQRLYGFQIYERQGEEFRLTKEWKDEVEKWGGIGVLYGLYRADPWSNKQEENGITLELSMKVFNMVQKYVIEHSRFGIPMLLSSECPHGHQALGGGLLPVNLAVGSTFHPMLLEEGYKACGKQLASGHVDLALMSVLDVLRDPRWGRSEECYSEDPYLSAKMAKAAVSGMQKSKVSAVAKHFCAQGETTGGINASAARIGERELREIHFPAMEACCEAGVDGVMAAYNEVDGIYCHANEWLLKKVLREEMGFCGVVMADGLAIDCLNTVTNDFVKSGALALRSGVDISLWDIGFSRLLEAFEEGYINEKEINEAVLRVLELKFRRGLFEHPYMEKNMISSAEAGIDEVSLALARESVILLKNENKILPLAQGRKIAVLGSNATERYSQLGDYTPPVSKKDVITILDGLNHFASENTQIIYARGCGFNSFSENELEDAVCLAEKSDVVIMVLGGSSSRFEEAEFDLNGAAITGEKTLTMDCGEGVDIAELSLSKAQIELFKRVKQTKKPIVVVLMGGRPYAIEEIAEESSALLCSFYPGPYGGQAIAEIIYGIYAPSGCLPVSIPRHAGQLPVYYNQKASYRSMQYCDKKRGPLFCFGDGLHYTEFAYKDFSIKQMDNGNYEISFCVSNVGKMESGVIIQLYIRKEGGLVVPRVKELKGFTKIFLKPKEKSYAKIYIEKKELTIYNLYIKENVHSDRIYFSLYDGEKELWNDKVLTYY